jgi:hypothetical protein
MAGGIRGPSMAVGAFTLLPLLALWGTGAYLFVLPYWRKAA